MPGSSKQDRSKKGPRLSWTPELVTFVQDACTVMNRQQMADLLGVAYRQVESIMTHSRLNPGGLMTHRDNGRWGDLAQWPVTTWAYMAGLIDGEGTITIARGTVKGTAYLRPVVCVTNTSIALWHWLAALGMQVTAMRNANGKGYYKATLSGFGIEPLLRGMLPHLIIKKALCELLLEFISIRKGMRLRYSPTPRMLRIFQEVKGINTRGSRFSAELRRHRKSLTSPQKKAATKLRAWSRTTATT